MSFLYPRSVGAASRIAGRLLDRTTTPSILSTPPPCPAQWHSHRPFSKATAPAVPAQATTPPTPTTHPDNPDAASLSDQVRLLMRRVPYPVAIITATDPHAETPAYRGMTVSSLNTVTLHPDPVVSFNVKRPSETLTALQSSGCFLVHLLAPGRATAALARDFARGNHHLTIVGDEGGDFEFVPLPPAPSPGEGPLHPRPLPLLRRKRDADCAAEADAAGIVSRDFPFVFECRLHPHSVRVHDHTIVVGTVVRALHGCNAETTSAADLCLTYANTRFWAMGHEI